MVVLDDGTPDIIPCAEAAELTSKAASTKAEVIFIVVLPFVISFVSWQKFTFYRALRGGLCRLPQNEFWHVPRDHSPYGHDVPPFRGFLPRGAWRLRRDDARRGCGVRRPSYDALLLFST